MCTGVQQLGVPVDWIVQFVQKKESFSKVSKAAILDTLEEMVGESTIYSIGPKSYKSIT